MLVLTLSVLVSFFMDKYAENLVIVAKDPEHLLD